MADRPRPDDPKHASYSPPPQHRPTWIDDGWGQQGSTLPPARPRRPALPPPRSHPRRRRTSTLLAVAVVAAMMASLGTYTMLLATGQLDRTVLVSEPLGQQTGVRTLAEREIVRVVEEVVINQETIPYQK